MAEEVILILHGWGGNKPAHWQEILAGKLRESGATVFYPTMPNPAAPDLAAWQEALGAELAKIEQTHPGARLSILAHSLGGINWLHFANKNAASGKKWADRVLLVAPPYVMPEAPPVDAPPSVTGFFPPPFNPASLASAAGETVIIASDTDDYATFDQSTGYAAKLGIPIHLLKGAGHISPYYGYGEWPWSLEWALRRADLPPVPREA